MIRTFRGGYFIPCCDRCDVELQAELSYRAAVDAMKKAKWIFKTEDGEVVNLCPAHKDEETEAANEKKVSGSADIRRTDSSASGFRRK